ncbi:MAG: ROK family protein [Solirubrobacterales bacterium]|nr:ROK family protein [Solirubrobacterales bacterium]
MLVGVMDDQQQVLHVSRERSRGLTEDEILAALEEELREAHDRFPDVVGAGLGIPCTIDQKRGVAISAVNLPIIDLPIRDLLRERSGLPISIDNDANTAALAEHLYGAAKGIDDAILLTIGTGIGGGVIIGGKVYRGAIGAAGELGHVVVDENGPPCQGNCPNHGCVETMASGMAISRKGKAAAEKHPSSALGKALADGTWDGGRTVTDAAQAGDEVARQVVATAGRHLGVALSSLANIFNPGVIVIGGGVSAVGDLLLQPAREELSSRALKPMNTTPVVVAQAGEDAGMVGAAAMALIDAESGG